MKAKYEVGEFHNSKYCRCVEETDCEVCTVYIYIYVKYI